MDKIIVHANSGTLQSLLEANTLVFVDFYADWCGPCKIIAPSIAALAEEFKENVKFAKLNIDENPETAQRYGVKSIPTLIIFRRGKPIRTMVGASPVSHYREELEKVVTKSLPRPQG